MSGGDGMSPGMRAKKYCEARLRALVPPDEGISSVGTAQELHKLDSDIGSGGGWTFLVVTPARVLFANWGSDEGPHEEIRFDDVTHWAQGTQYNCHVLALTHPSMTRRQHVPAHSFLWFRWGNAEADVTRTQTIFRFSRPDTDAAKALRAALEKRELPTEHLRFHERSREERTRGSHVVLTRKG